MPTTIYGASDDLIEVEGDIDEEFNVYGEEDPFYLGFSDGTLLSVLYDSDGCWRINKLRNGSATYSKDEALSDEGEREDGKPSYSDVVTLDGYVTWVLGGKAYA